MVLFITLDSSYAVTYQHIKSLWVFFLNFFNNCFKAAGLKHVFSDLTALPS